jgi:hypothetical protein
MPICTKIRTRNSIVYALFSYRTENRIAIRFAANRTPTRIRELVQGSRNWSVRSDFERTVKFCLYSRGKHSPWLLTPYLGLECKG